MRSKRGFLESWVFNLILFGLYTFFAIALTVTVRENTRRADEAVRIRHEDMAGLTRAVYTLAEAQKK